MLSPNQVLDHYYLEVRCMLLEIAATLDRHDRALQQSPNGKLNDSRLDKLYAALSELAQRDGQPNRSERLLQLFSDPA